MKVHSRRPVPLASAVIACALGLTCPGTTVPATGAAVEQGLSRDPAVDSASWAIDPGVPGPDFPPAGRSLFDHLVVEPTDSGKTYQVPFPFSALIERIQARLANREFMGGSRVVIIPMGRSLQRVAAAPDFFKYPRIVFAVTGEPRTDAHDAGVLLKDRLYIGYVEKTAMLEVISYNETAGRFEFQLVKDYRAGAQPKVFYANRAICTSCHQNHAPIFSRPVWGETNANGRVAELLRGHGTDLQLSTQANIDFPDDVDKATLRANALVFLQTIWRQGCADAHDPAQSRRCRAAGFAAVLQYGLSGEQDFDSASPRYRNDMVSTLARAWSQRWPRGLEMSESALPDRNPLGGAVSSYGGGGSDEAPFDWIGAANVPASLDPLDPRPPREIWRVTGGMDTERMISGWARFFAADDFRGLDRYLRERGGDAKLRQTVYQARCTVARDTSRAKEWTLQCVSDVAAPQEANLAARFDETGKGRIDWLNLGPAGRVRDVTLSSGAVQVTGSQSALRAATRRQGLAARLPDGRLLANIQIRWPVEARAAKPTAPMQAQFEAVVVDDFALVRQAIDRLLEQQPALFDDGPLVRVNLMRALFSALGMPRRAWCCTDDAGMPPPALDMPELDAGAITQSALQPFFRYCATCHLTHERFPPNFLTGDASRVEAALRQCAPRMLVRLSAWGIPTDQRTKSPMPPETALRALGTTRQQWVRSEALDRLRSYVEVLTRQGQASGAAEMSQGNYEALPPCLPSAHTQ